MNYNWTTPIRYIRGMGPTRTKELVKIGIHTVGDLLERKPLSYIYPGMTSIADAKEGMIVVKAKVSEVKQRYGSTVAAAIYDDTGSCKAIWYNGVYILRGLHSGMTAIFYGKMKGGVLQQPRWTCVPETMTKIYGGQYGETHHATIRAALVEALDNVELPEVYGGISRAKVFRTYHFPEDKVEQQKALQMLKEDEAIQLALALQGRRKKQEQYVGVRVEI